MKDKSSARAVVSSVENSGADETAARSWAALRVVFMAGLCRKAQSETTTETCRTKKLDNVASGLQAGLKMKTQSAKERSFPMVVSLSQVAIRLGVKRSQLTEWVRLGLVPTPFSLGRRRNGRTVAYVFPEADLPALARLVDTLKKGVRG